MNLETLKHQFDQALAKMSDEDIVKAFETMGCEVVLDEQQSEPWIVCETESCHLSFRHTSLTFNAGTSFVLQPADSNELALAA